MKTPYRYFVFLALLQMSNITTAQDTLAADSLGWKLSGQAGFNFSQVHLSNWSAGGQSNLSLISLGGLKLVRKGKSSGWESYLDAAYGLLRPQEGIWLKTDDRIEIGSKYGKHAFKHFYYTASTTFRTQFAPGYEYPNDSVRVSEFLAPGYLLLSLGMDYKPNDRLSLFLSPLTGKVTFVMDEALANAGYYGVEPARFAGDGSMIEPGEQIRKEFGAYLKLMYTRKLADNITLKTIADLFSNYLDRPGNIDINWENALLMKVNKYITVNIGTHLIYDDDVKLPVDDNGDGETDRLGPRTQFKEILNVGLLYQF